MATSNRNRTAPRPGPARQAPAPVKQAPAPAPEKIDYSALVASDVDLPKGSRNSQLDGTPFVGWLQESAANRTPRTIKRDGEDVTVWRGSGKAVPVPESGVKQVVYLLRAAAREVGCGIRIVPGRPVNGTVTVSFAASEQRASKPSK